MMDDSDVETTESELLGLLPYRFEPTSHESDTSVIVTVNYQPTFLHVHVLITQLGAQVSSVLLTERECCCFLELAHIRHHFSDVEGLQHIADHTKFAGACLNPLTLCITLVSVVVAT